MPSEGLKSLVELNLRKNRIKIIAEIKNLPRLQKLYMSFNQIEGVG